MVNLINAEAFYPKCRLGVMVVCNWLRLFRWVVDVYVCKWSWWTNTFCTQCLDPYMYIPTQTTKSGLKSLFWHHYHMMGFFPNQYWFIADRRKYKMNLYDLWWLKRQTNLSLLKIPNILSNKGIWRFVLQNRE